MSFCFYPKHEHGCRQVGHCPHLGGAPLGLLVLAANENEASHEQLLRQLEAERERASRLWAENESLKQQLAKAKGADEQRQRQQTATRLGLQPALQLAKSGNQQLRGGFPQ